MTTSGHRAVELLAVHELDLHAGLARPLDDAAERRMLGLVLDPDLAHVLRLGAQGLLDGMNTADPAHGAHGALPISLGIAPFPSVIFFSTSGPPLCLRLRFLSLRARCAEYRRVYSPCPRAPWRGDRRALA